MKTVKQFLKKISWSKILAIFFAGIVVLSGTACTASQAMSPPTNDSTIDRSDRANQAMYPHRDTERDTQASDAKADRMIRNAQQRRRIDSREDLLNRVTPDKPVGEQVREAGQSARQGVEDLGRSTKEGLKDAAEGTQRGVRNIRDNAQNAIERTSDAIDRATSH
ncbi:MAG: hypothetical protein VKL39_18230 [Leptolyngbyaceae bacterium]|nr:hypothetical protein [Leptolyngbyaceae bacterium]